MHTGKMKYERPTTPKGCRRTECRGMTACADPLTGLHKHMPIEPHNTLLLERDANNLFDKTHHIDRRPTAVKVLTEMGNQIGWLSKNTVERCALTAKVSSALERGDKVECLTASRWMRNGRSYSRTVFIRIPGAEM